MKKNLKIITFTVIVLTFCVLLLFCIKVDKISLIENIRQKIAKTKEAEQRINEVTIIDVTDLKDGGNIQHEHIFKTMYDETNHWEECMVCGEENNKITHSYTDTWATNSIKCYSNNYATRVCSCGYSYIYHEPCVWKGEYLGSAYYHYRKCSNCKKGIEYQYYDDYRGNHKLCAPDINGDFEADETKTSYWCRDSNGIKLDCNHPGKCATCGNIYTISASHYLHGNNYLEDKKNSTSTSKLTCLICGNEYGEYTTKLETDSNTPKTYTIEDTITLKNGATFAKVENIRDDLGIWESNIQTVAKENPVPTNTNFRLVSIGKMKNKVPYDAYTSFYVYINGQACRVTLSAFRAYPDFIKPTISNITMGDGSEELIEWSKTKPIYISGIENWCDTVNVKIIDDNESVIFDGSGAVNNSNYSISCTPELECDTNGRTFKAIVTDACENSIEQTFTIAKVDSYAPIPKSGIEILGDWAKSKKFTFKATDGGIGNVSIAFNDIKDLQLANSDGIEYSRDYEFVGDVYNQKELSVLYRDGLGNMSIQKNVINKIDNTAPTILETEFHNNKLIIKSNDEKEGLGEGSGVVKYRYFTSKEKIENPELQSSAKEVDKDDEIIIDDIVNMKYVYVVAEDYAGNISKVYEVEVPKLVLTSEVQLDGSNGKGAVKLDWSSYDIEDKYFVIYRKEENEEDWETIVSLEEKFKGSSYIDNLANDKNSPNMPNIVINGDKENNNINIVANSEDNGSRYVYYVEAYDKTNLLINISNKTN